MTDSPPDRTAEVPTRRSRSRSALIATGIALPLTVILALALANPRSTAHNTPSMSAVQVSAPPLNPTTTPACNKLLTTLPTELATLAPRTVKSQPSSPYVLAWGDPAVVLRCGVAKPAGFVATSLVYAVNKVYWFQAVDGNDDVFTSIDRSAYIEVRVPKKQLTQPLAAISDAIVKALPAVCAVPEHATDDSSATLCTHR